MNIVLVNDYSYVNGGASQVALTTAKLFAMNGNKVTLFTAVGPIDEELKHIPNLKVICLEGYDLLNDPNRIRAMIKGIWNFNAAKKFRELLLNFDNKDTIIHIHSYSKSLSASVIRTAIKLDFKVVYHLHDYGVICPNMGLYNYQQGKICDLYPLSNKCIISNCDSRSYLHKVWRCLRQYSQLYMGNIPNGLKNIIVVSQFSKFIIQKYLPHDTNLFLMRNPVNVIHNTSSQPEKNKYYIFVGRLSKEKDPLILARVAKTLNIPVVFVGDGDLSKVIMEFSNCIITGWLDRQQVTQYIRNARAIILPSRLYETQGMVVEEAAAQGIPAIIAGSSAAIEFVEADKNGLLFDTGNESDLAKKIMMLQDDSFLKRMGKAAYDKFWEGNQDMNSYISQLEKLYNDILSSHYK